MTYLHNPPSRIVLLVGVLLPLCLGTEAWAQSISWDDAFDHVLYNINNESSEGAVWENYWARTIKQAAADRGREAYVTTMQFDPSN